MALLRWFSDSVGKEFYPRFISRIMIVLNSFCILCKLLVNVHGGYGPLLEQMTEQWGFLWAYSEKM